ncbi:MAG: hypothetical protein HeimC3_47260, partial [Candidatus Heimdallarchaeota archaeon LC_3]
MSDLKKGIKTKVKKLRKRRTTRRRNTGQSLSTSLGSKSSTKSSNDDTIGDWIDEKQKSNTFKKGRTKFETFGDVNKADIDFDSKTGNYTLVAEANDEFNKLAFTLAEQERYSRYVGKPVRVRVEQVDDFGFAIVKYNNRGKVISTTFLSFREMQEEHVRKLELAELRKEMFDKGYEEEIKNYNKLSNEELKREIINLDIQKANKSLKLKE